MIEDKDPENMKGVKVYASPAYLKPLEKGLFGLFRNIEVEDRGSINGEPVREKIRTIGPIKTLREAARGEEQLVKLRTVHPDTGELLELVEVE